MAKNKYVISREALLRDDPDAWCVLLGTLGFSMRCIRENTGLTNNQIAYRLYRRGIYLRDYRNGHNVMAQYVIKSTGELPPGNPLSLEFNKRLRLPKAP